MHIVQLIAPGPLAGAEKVVLEGSTGLARAGHDVSLLVLDEQRVPVCARSFVDSALKNDLHVIRIPVRGRFDVRALFELSRALRKSSPDVVHTHGYKALSYALMASTGSALFATHHGDTSHTERIKLYERSLRLMYQHIAGVFAVSEETARALSMEGVSGSRVKIVENPLCLEAPKPFVRERTSQTMELLFLGRLSREKGVDVLLRALALRPDRGAISLTVAGEGPCRSELEALSQELRISSQVRFIGHQADVAGLLRTTDALVLPSLREGLPLSVLEAAAFGIPVIATRVGGVHSVVDEGVTGLLTEPGDAQGLATAIMHVRADLDGFLWAARSRAKHIQKRFSVDRWVKATVIGYRSVVS